MTFDWTISLGGIVSIVANLIGVIIGAVIMYYKTREWVFKLHVDNKVELSQIKQTLSAMEPKIDSMWEWFIRRRNGP